MNNIGKFGFISVLLCSALHAERIPATIIDAAVNSVPGADVIIRGTIWNPTPEVLLGTELFVNAFGFDPSAITIEPLSGLADVFIQPGAASPVVELFRVTLASTAIPGRSYDVKVFVEDVLGNSSDVLDITVTAQVPEPSTFALAIACILLLVSHGSRLRNRRSVFYMLKRRCIYRFAAVFMPVLCATVLNAQPRFAIDTASVSVNEDRTVSLALPLANRGTVAAQDVRIATIKVESATRVAPAVLPLAVGTISVGSSASVQTIFTSQGLRSTTDRQLVTIQGTYVFNGSLLGFSASRYVSIAALPQVSQPVMPIGGSITLDGYAVVTFPAGSFSSTQPVDVSATASAETATDFQDAAEFVGLGARSPYEIRITTNSAPQAAVEVTLTVPASLRAGTLPSARFLILAQILQNRGLGVLDNFEILPSVYSAQAQTVKAVLPKEAFTNLRNSSNLFEAVVILATRGGGQPVGALNVPANVEVQNPEKHGLRDGEISVERPTSIGVSGSFQPAASSTCSAESLGPPMRNLHVFSKFDPPAHYGTDYDTPDGTDVMAMRDGVILKVGWQEKALKVPDPRSGKTVRGWGRYVVIKHGDGSTTLYAHLKKDGVTVKVGAEVKQGDVIGDSNNSGGSTGPHLHVEYAPNGDIYGDGKIDPDACIVGADAVSRIELQPNPVSVELGQNTALKVSAWNAMGQSMAIVASNLRWSTSDGSVATVSTSGTISGVKVGTATVTVQDTASRVTAQVTVTVSPACVTPDGAPILWPATNPDPSAYSISYTTPTNGLSVSTTAAPLTTGRVYAILAGAARTFRVKQSTAATIDLTLDIQVTGVTSTALTRLSGGTLYSSPDAGSCWVTGSCQSSGSIQLKVAPGTYIFLSLQSEACIFGGEGVCNGVRDFPSSSVSAKFVCKQ